MRAGDNRSASRLEPLKFALESSRIGDEGGVGWAQEPAKKWEDPQTTLRYVLRVTE